MTSIRHSDTVELHKRRERVRNELTLIDAELARRADVERQRYRQERDAWVEQSPPMRQALIESWPR